MRALLMVVVVAFLAWSGWWWIASRGGVSAVEAGIVALRAQGWSAGHQGLSVSGYPNRIDLTAQGPALATPDRRWQWQAPFVQVFALSYRPWHVIAAFAPEQQIATPVGALRLTAGRLQASVVVEPGTDLVLDRSQLAGEALRLSGAFEASAERLSMATRPTVGAALSHDFGLSVTGLRPADGMVRLLPAALRDTPGAEVRVDAALGFDAPLDRHAVARPPALTRIDLREARIGWGAVRAHLSGQLVPDARGFAEGRLSLRLEGGEQALQAMQALGWFPPQAMAQWEATLRLLAPGGQPLELPLRLGQGVVMLGPLPLGPAPRMRP